jgi:hypothetical protein
MHKGIEQGAILQFSERGLQIFSQNQGKLLVYTFFPLSLTWSTHLNSPIHGSDQPLNTKMKRGFFPNTSKNLLQLLLSSMSIMAINNEHAQCY